MSNKPLSPALRTALEEIGFTPEDIPPDINDKDAIQVLAFHKFLASGRWSTSEDGRAIYSCDPDAFAFAKGEMDAKSYLLADQTAKSPDLPE